MVFGTLLMCSCADDVRYSKDARFRLTFSSDTLSFDTLFTGVPSVTGMAMIYNPNDVSLNVVDARLEGGWDSPFRVNLDGQYGVEFGHLDMHSGDSLYVFVEVTAKPFEEAEPLKSLSDALVFTLESGVVQKLILTATGLNAIVIRSETLTADTCFNADRFLLIYDSLVVAPDVTLTIDAGTTLCFHDKAELHVHGTLCANGTADSMVIFRGDRLDRMQTNQLYDHIEGQWGGIVLCSDSHDNRLTHCDVHSSSFGIRAEATDMTRPSFLLESCRIHNVIGHGLEATLCNGTALNSLFSNAGRHCVSLLGGNYEFIHCTLAQFHSLWGRRGESALNLNNIADKVVYPLLKADFVNCIITGHHDDELMGEVAELGDTLDLTPFAQYLFSHSLLNTSVVESSHYEAIAWEGPDSTICGMQNFVDARSGYFLNDFHLDSLSHARGIADKAYLSRCPVDFDGLPRDTVAPDAGCFQYRPASE